MLIKSLSMVLVVVIAAPMASNAVMSCITVCMPVRIY
jgi:hypothetical protein